MSGNYGMKNGNGSGWPTRPDFDDILSYFYNHSTRKLRHFTSIHSTKSKKCFVHLRRLVFNLSDQSITLIPFIQSIIGIFFGKILMIAHQRCPSNDEAYENVSELTVFGYARRHSVSDVPASLVILMLQFYDLWLHRCFTKDEITRLLAMSGDDRLEFPIDNIAVNDTNFCVYLQARFDSCWISYVDLFVCITLPWDIRFVSCVVLEDETEWQSPHKWIRVTKEHGDIDGHSGSHNHDIIEIESFIAMSDVEEKLKNPMSLYVDIMQIMYTPEADARHQDFDETEPFEIRKRQWKWKIHGKALEKLQSNQDDYWRSAQSSRDGQWKCEVAIYSATRHVPYRLIVVYMCCSPLPLNVSSVGIMVTVKSNIEGKRFEEQTMLSMEGSYIQQEMDLEWDTESILKASSIDLEIKMEAFKVFDHDEREIAEVDWEMHGILPCKDVVEHSQHEDK